MTILMIPLVVLTAVLWIWAFIDITRSRFERFEYKWLWIFLIILFPVLGSIGYFQFGKITTKNSRRFNPDFITNNG